MIVKLQTPEPPDDAELVETDGEPLESNWHRLAMNFLIEVVTCHCRERKDYFVGGNMFIYFNAEQARTRDFRGPDFFFVEGVRWDPLRRYWVVWKEDGKLPDVIIELLSPTTAEIDRTVKKDVYEKVFQTLEYYCYDPDEQHLEGWRLRDGVYVPIAPNEQGRLWCEKLGLWLGTWNGPFLGIEALWLRFFDAAGNVVLIGKEAEALRADEERLRAEEARQRAEEARQRAETAEAEVARLRAELVAVQAQAQPPKP